MRNWILALLLTPLLASAAEPPHCEHVSLKQARELASMTPLQGYTTYDSGRVALEFGAPPRERSLRPCKVTEFFSRVRRFEHRQLVAKTPGHVLESGWARLLLDGHPVFDFADHLERPEQGDDSAGADEREYLHDTVTAVPLSFVGPVLTFEIDDIQSGGIVGPPARSETWKTVDARTRKPADLLEWVDETALVEALKQDSYVQRVSNANALAEVKTLAQFQALGSKWSEGLSDDPRQTFSFFDYDARKDLVAIRFPIYENPGFNHSKMNKIVAWVKPKAALRQALLAAQHGEGLLNRNAKAE